MAQGVSDQFSDQRFVSIIAAFGGFSQYRRFWSRSFAWPAGGTTCQSS
jgi:hypothetical protein